MPRDRLVAQGRLPVSNSAADPLARLRDGAALGNTPNADGRFGDRLLMLASGNHARFRNRSLVPDGT